MLSLNLVRYHLSTVDELAAALQLGNAFPLGQSTCVTRQLLHDFMPNPLSTDCLKITQRLRKPQHFRNVPILQVKSDH